MKILLVEDDPIKLKTLNDYIISDFPGNHIDVKMSYQSGLRLIMKNSYDVVLLDMQLPNYDIKSGEDGYKHRPLAGRDILKEIKRKKIETKVIIITQYDTFGEDGNFSSLSEWHMFFSKNFAGIYLQTIFYNPGSSSWKLLLKELLNPLK